MDLTHITQTRVKGDPGRLRQILTNLVANSIRFTEEGEIILSAGLKSVSPSELIFYCKVQDTGIGISKQKQAALFDAFTQVDTSTTRMYGGTGLGLSINKRLCELMGGSINVTSEVGQGSCFEFTVKLKTCEDSVPLKPEFSVNELAVLLVDDNESCRKVTSSQLEMWGVKVACVASGDSALELLTQSKRSSTKPIFDLILVDMGMPEMDGEQFVKLIKANKLLADNKLIMMSSLGHRQDKSYYTQLGCVGHFSKPITPFALIKALKLCDFIKQEQACKSLLDTDHQNDSRDVVPPSEVASSETLDHLWPDNCRILVVEDNPINQLVTLGILEDLGLAVEVAKDGREAINALKSALDTNPFNLIFMDCQMPIMDGYDASIRIRRGEAGESNTWIPIVALTAHSMKGDKERCIAAGMNDYISKPVDPDFIEEKLKTWLTGLSSGQEK